MKKTAKGLGMMYYYKAKKPRQKGYNYIIDKTKVKKENILMIGDQLFTDIYGGNRFGIKTVLVKPINKKEIIVSKVKRPIEKFVLMHYYKKKGENI